MLASCACRCTKASKGAGARTPPRIPRTPLRTASAALQAFAGRGRAVSARAAAPSARSCRRPDPNSIYVEQNPSNTLRGKGTPTQLSIMAGTTVAGRVYPPLGCGALARRTTFKDCSNTQREPRPTDGLRRLAFASDWEGFDCDCAQCATGRSRCGFRPQAHRPEGPLWMCNLYIEAMKQVPEAAPASKLPEVGHFGL